MTQKFTILFDLDGTLVDTAPDLMNAHNHVMRKFGYETKSTDDIRKLVGQGAGSSKVVKKITKQNGSRDLCSMIQLVKMPTL